MFRSFIFFIMIGVFVGCGGGAKTDVEIPEIVKVN